MFTPSVADPQNTPPDEDPCATRRSQTILPLASGSTPKMTPDLLPTTISWRPPPAGPYSCVPTLFFVVGTAFSATVYVFQRRLPVFASSATTLPRNVQHGYRGSPTCDSSREETGT